MGADEARRLAAITLATSLLFSVLISLTISWWGWR